MPSDVHGLDDAFRLLKEDVQFVRRGVEHYTDFSRRTLDRVLDEMQRDIDGLRLSAVLERSDASGVYSMDQKIRDLLKGIAAAEVMAPTLDRAGQKNIRKAMDAMRMRLYQAELIY